MMYIASLLTDRIDLVFIGNSIGQILFIGLATFFVVSWHTERKYTPSFLRLKWYNNTFLFILPGSLAMLAVQPLVVYLGYWNSLITIPDCVTDMQISQTAMRQNSLT